MGIHLKFKNVYYLLVLSEAIGANLDMELPHAWPTVVVVEVVVSTKNML